MKKIIVFLFFVNTLFAQNFTCLIGIDNDKGVFIKPYIIVESESEKYKPQTIGICRNGDKVELYVANYLVIPSRTGFIYATINVEESKFVFDDYVEEGEPDYLKERYNGFTNGERVVNPVFFKSKNKVRSFVKNNTSNFKSSVSLDYKQFSFITPFFYIAKGYECSTHSGANAYSAEQISNIFPLAWRGKKLSSKLGGYIPSRQLSGISFNCLRDLGYVNEKSGMEYLIENEEDVYFDIRFGSNGVFIDPLVKIRLSGRYSLPRAKQHVGVAKMYSYLKLKQAKSKLIIFTSPDKLTRIEIDENKVLKVIDIKTNKILLTSQLDFNKIIMAEFAQGKYAEIWKKEFK